MAQVHFYTALLFCTGLIFDPEFSGALSSPISLNHDQKFTEYSRDALANVLRPVKSCTFLVFPENDDPRNLDQNEEGKFNTFKFHIT